MQLSDRFDDALAYARQVHDGQLRKGTQIPYFAHLIGVCSLVLEHGGDEGQAIAALLHDAAEDQGGEARLDDIEARFGGSVAAIVADCSDAWEEPKPPWRAHKEGYLAALPGKPQRSLLVSCADKLHNCRAIRTDVAADGAVVWDRFRGGRDGTVWYYRSLADIMHRALPGRLATELGLEVEALEALAIGG